MSSEAIYIESVIVELETGEGKLACTVTDFPIIEAQGDNSDPKLRTYQGTLPPAQYTSLGKFDGLIAMVAKRMGHDHDLLKSAGDTITVEITIIADYASESLLVGAKRKFSARWQNDHWNLTPKPQAPGRSDRAASESASTIPLRRWISGMARGHGGERS